MVVCLVLYCVRKLSTIIIYLFIYFKEQAQGRACQFHLIKGVKIYKCAKEKTKASQRIYIPLGISSASIFAPASIQVWSSSLFPLQEHCRSQLYPLEDSLISLFSYLPIIISKRVLNPFLALLFTWLGPASTCAPCLLPSRSPA